MDCKFSNCFSFQMVIFVSKHAYRLYKVWKLEFLSKGRVSEVRAHYPSFKHWKTIFKLTKGVEYVLKLDGSHCIKKKKTLLIQDNEHAYSEVNKMSSLLPTMWLGSQSGINTLVGT